MASREHWEFRDWAMTYIPTLVAPLLANPHCWWNHSNTRSVRRVIIKIARKLFLITLDEYSMNGKKFFYPQQRYIYFFDSIKVWTNVKKKKKKSKMRKRIVNNNKYLRAWLNDKFVRSFLHLSNKWI